MRKVLLRESCATLLFRRRDMMYVEEFFGRHTTVEFERNDTQKVSVYISQVLS